MTRNRLRLGIVCYPAIGGSGIVATMLGKALCERKYEIHFISHDLPPRLHGLKDHCTFHHIDVPVYPLFRFPPYTLALATELMRLVQEIGLQLLHVHYAIPHSTSAVLANLMLKERGLQPVPLLTTIHGTDTELVGREPLYRPVVEFSLNHCDALSAVSNSLKKSTQETFDCRTEIEVIHNFVDTDWFQPPENDRFPRDGHCWQIIHVSNFRPVKRVLDVIKVFDSVANCVPCRLLMVGDGPDRPAAQELAASLGLSDRITFAGKELFVERLLRQSDVLLSASSSESFGMSVAEAMASGLPVVASRVGGVPEVVVDGQSGILTPPGCPDAMAEALLEILTQPDLAPALGRAARQRIVDHFSTSAIVPRYESLYSRLAANNFSKG